MLLVEQEESSLIGLDDVDENRTPEEKSNELISFDADPFTPSQTNFQQVTSTTTKTKR